MTEAKRMPDLEVTDSSGSVTRTADWRGRRTVLFCYPRASMPGCTREAQEFSAALSLFAALDVRVIGVSRDTPAKLAGFAKKSALSVTLVCDHTGALTESLGVWVEKTMYGRTSMGIERATFLFDESGACVERWRKVRVPGHVEAVLDACQRHFGK